MQLDVFAPLPPTALQPLRVTDLPSVGELVNQIGTDEDWAKRTLSDVLELWYRLYDEYVDRLQTSRKQAEEWFKQNGAHYATASPTARQHYKREHIQLTDAVNLFHSIMDGLYCQRMETLISQTRTKLKAQGLPDEQIEGCCEFLGEVFQHPNPQDLLKTMPQLVEDLSREYLNLK